MQKILFFILAIGITICIIPQNTLAQDTQDWNLRGLPEGVKARFGKGYITGNFALSGDGKRLAVACSIGIWIYDTQTDKPLNLLIGHTDWVLNVAFSLDDTLLASASSDKTVRVWDARTGTELWTLKGYGHVTKDITFSSDSMLLATASANKTIRLWDVHTGKHLRTLDAHREAVTYVAFNPDGKTLASTSYDGTVLLWDFTSDNVD